MQLYIKQRIFSWTDSYDVYDETGEPRYEVRAEFFLLGIKYMYLTNEVAKK